MSGAEVRTVDGFLLLRLFSTLVCLCYGRGTVVFKGISRSGKPEAVFVYAGAVGRNDSRCLPKRRDGKIAFSHRFSQERFFLDS